VKSDASCGGGASDMSIDQPSASGSGASPLLGGAGAAATGLGAGDGAVAAGRSTRKMSEHLLHRTLTPRSGIFAGSTGKEEAHEGHVTVMTMIRLV
jgi:hypothetical protein